MSKRRSTGQQSNRKHDRETYLSSSRHLQSPDRTLWEEEDGDIYGSVEGCRGDLERFVTNTFTRRDTCVPKPSNGLAAKYYSKKARDIKQNIEHNQRLNPPEKPVPGARSIKAKQPV